MLEVDGGELTTQLRRCGELSSPVRTVSRLKRKRCTDSSALSGITDAMML